MSGESREGPLRRWSRRKHAAATGVDLDNDVVEQADQTAASEPAVDETLTDTGILEQLELPDPDKLTPGDDFRAFMHGAVPTHLRNRALRRLWLTNPMLAGIDGLVEYGEDFTNAAVVPEAIATAYKVGRGFARVPTERGENAPRVEATPDGNQNVSELAEKDAESHAPDPGPREAEAASPTSPQPPQAKDQEPPTEPGDPSPPPVPRRMRFKAA